MRKVRKVAKFVTDYLAAKPPSNLDENGAEKGGRPKVAPPIGYVQRESLALQVRRMVQSEHLARYALEQGKETFEESEDFDVDDDYDPQSPWENDHDPDIRELLLAGREAIAAKLKAQEARKSTSKENVPGESPAPPQTVPEVK